MTTSVPSRRAAGVVPAALAATLLSMVLASPVLGHASLVTSDPAQGSSVPGSATTKVTLTFDDDLDPAKSQFLLVDASGATVATGHVTAAPRVMEATGLTLSPGAYEARWTAMASDGDMTRGIVPFQVVQGGGVSAAPTTAADTTSSPATPAPVDPASSPTPADSTGGTIAAIVVALVLVGILGFIVLRRSRQAGQP